MVAEVHYWIEQLALLPHPEGGYYKETYRSREEINSELLPKRFSGSRNFSTAIYFLLPSEGRSLFHRIKSDELWHFHKGSSLFIYVLSDSGIKIHVLGDNPVKGESLQVVIPANTWFGAKVNESDSYTLAGCTVAPGFDFNDFELASRDELLNEFPALKEVIIQLTKE
ncbi:MAG TPA: cupin domain-containing protein [Cyclobacteriaceae bacterium]